VRTFLFKTKVVVSIYCKPTNPANVVADA